MEIPPSCLHCPCEKINNQQVSCILPDFRAFVKDGTEALTMDRCVLLPHLFWERKTVLGGVLCCKIELFGQLW
jgi:hypothetical protein